MPPSLSESGIRVSADGVKLGWTVLAGLASIGLGLYIAMVITPIRKDLDNIGSDMTNCKKIQYDNGILLSNHISKMEADVKARDRRIDILERKVEFLEHPERKNGHQQYPDSSATITNKSNAP